MTMIGPNDQIARAYQDQGMVSPQLVKDDAGNSYYQSGGATPPVTVKPLGKPKSPPAPPEQPAIDAATVAKYAKPPVSDATEPGSAAPSTPADAKTVEKYASPPDDQPSRDVGAGEAAAVGLANTATVGTAPLIAGGLQAAAAKGEKAAPTLPSPDLETPEGQEADAGAKSLAGAWGMLKDWMSGTTDPDVHDAFERGRQLALQDQQLSREQHPSAYIAGQLAGLVATAPLFGGARATGGVVSKAAPAISQTVKRIAGASKTGALSSGAYSAGEAASQEESPADIATEAASGAVRGGLFGAGGSALAEGLGAGAGWAASVLRGARQGGARTEAAKRVAGSLAADWSHEGGPGLSGDAERALGEAETPTAIVDYGGERTRALARSAANTSPEARQDLSTLAQERFEQQSPRIAGFVRRLTGGADAGADRETLEAAARAYNRPQYARAYAKGAGPISSPKLSELQQAPAVAAAMKAATRRGMNRAVADGTGKTFDPKQPSIQFWDYVQREMRDATGSAARAGRNEEAGAVDSLHRQLKDELDRLVPEFGQARRGAAEFFGADSALEAGQKFVMSSANIGEARRAVAKMSAPERELFARGFASDLADKIEKTGDHINVINQAFLKSTASREKITLALGPDRARQLETMLRAEGIVDKLRLALQNSTTVRQAVEGGLAGGSAVSIYDWLEGNEFSPSHVLSGTLTGAFANLVREKGAKVIDERVSRHVGELLASDDPELLRKGVAMIANNPTLLNAFRDGTTALARLISVQAPSVAEHAATQEKNSSQARAARQ